MKSRQRLSLGAGVLQLTVGSVSICLKYQGKIGVKPILSQYHSIRTVRQREKIMRGMSPRALFTLAAMMALAAIGRAQTPTGPDAAAQSPAAPTNSPASDQKQNAKSTDGSGHGKARKAAKKQAAEEEEEWVLGPEPVKPAAAASAAAVDAAGAPNAPSAAPADGPASNLASTPETAANTGNLAPAQEAATSVPPGETAPAATATTATPAATPAAASSEAPAPVAAGEQRLALVIGNSNYKVGHLPNSLNDAQSVAAMLKSLGWQVIEREDVGRDEMAKTAEEFGNQLASGGGVGLFYYAGHGIQSGNVNYLIPVDADIQDEDELPAHAYDSSDILHRMDRAKNRLNLVILDACRNNPFASRFSTVAKGLAGVQPGSETAMIISYATMPGATAADGTGGNGLYTSELLHAMSQQGLGVEGVFKEVRSEVKKKSGGKQIPYDASSLTSDFYFNPTTEQAAQEPLLAGNAVGRDAAGGQSRSIAPVLVSQKLFQNYQLSANLPLPATVAVAKYFEDGSSFLTVTADRKLRVWDVATGSITMTDPSFGAPSLSVNGRFVLGTADAHTLHVLDTDTKGAAVKTYQVPTEIEAAGLSPDARRLLIYSKERGFFLMDTGSAAVLGDARKVDGSPQFAFAPTGNRVLLWGSKSSDLYLWDTETGKRVSSLGGHHKPVGVVRFSKDGSELFTAAEADSAIVWQTANGSELRKLALDNVNPLPIQAEFIDGGKHVLLNLQRTPGKTGDAGYLLGTWDVATGKPLGAFATNVMAKALRFSPDETRLFVTGPDNSTRVFDLATKTQIDALNGAELLGFSTDGRRLIARDGDGIRLYETHGLTPIARMPNQVAAFLGPKVGNLYATASADGKVRLINFETGDTISTLEGHIDPVTAVNFAPDGKQLVTFSDEKVAKLWALPNVHEMSRLIKDSFESSAEYQKRVADWSSDYTALVSLGEYNADAESYTVNVGKISVVVPMPRDDARHMAGQKEAILSGRLKFYDADRLQLSDAKLSRIP
jgi:WD40 repeat protein